MTVLPEALTEGGQYITEPNSIGHTQLKEILKIFRDKKTAQGDIVEYRSKTFGSNSPWVNYRCSRNTFAKSVLSELSKADA